MFSLRVPSRPADARFPPSIRPTLDLIGIERQKPVFHNLKDLTRSQQFGIHAVTPYKYMKKETGSEFVSFRGAIVSFIGQRNGGNGMHGLPLALRQLHSSAPIFPCLLVFGKPDTSICGPEQR